MSWFPTNVDLQLFHCAAQTPALWAFKRTSCLFSKSVFSPRKHFHISHLSSHISLSLYVSRTKLRHAQPLALKKRKKEQRLWETNQPFTNYMPLFRQIKLQITATILQEKRAVTTLDTHLLHSTCFDSVSSSTTMKEKWMIIISSAY